MTCAESAKELRAAGVARIAFDQKFNQRKNGNLHNSQSL